jgi:hypothetical protein
VFLMTRVTTGNGRFLGKFNAIETASARQKECEAFHDFGKSTTSARQFRGSFVVQLNDN